MGARRVLHKKFGQASAEYLVLLMGAILIAFVGVQVIGLFNSPLDPKIGASQAYWASASPIAVKSWNVIGTVPDQNGMTTVQLAILVQNPTGKSLTLRKVTAGSLNFSLVYSHGSSYAGSADNLSVRLAPSEQNMLALIQVNGSTALQQSYELQVEFTYDGDTPGQVESGSLPLVGRMEEVGYSRAVTPPGTGCDVGQIACNTGGIPVCCDSTQICSAGTMCCNVGQVACSGACCAGSCISNTCVPSGCQLCGGAVYCGGGGSCPFADYVVSFINASPLLVTPGQELIVNFTVSNTGTGNSSTVTEALVAIGGIENLTNSSVQGLSSGESAEILLNWTCTNPKDGWYTITAYADATHQISELNESNNARSFPLQVHCAATGEPDMTIGAVAVSNSSLLVGQSANITVNTSNSGGASSDNASTTTVKLIGNSSNITLGSFSVPNLSAGGSNVQTVVFNCTAGTIGTYIINATADFANAVQEGGGESNNYDASQTISCGGPDLVVEYVTQSPMNLSVGDYGIILLKTTNVGTTDAADSVTALNATGGSGNPLSETQFDIPSLTPGLVKNSGTVFTCNSSFLGVWTVYAYADNTSLVSELNETNNINTTIVNCSGLDLEVNALSSSVPNPVGSGATTNITVPMHNAGAPGNGTWQVSPYVDIAPSGPMIGSSPDADVPWNGTIVEGTFNLTCPDDLVSDTDYVVNVTAPQAAGESDLSNNWKAKTITCEQNTVMADLALMPLTMGAGFVADPFGQYSLNSGQTGDIDIKMLNVGPVKLSSWNVTPNAAASGGTLGAPPNMLVPKDGTIATGIIQFTCPDNLAKDTNMTIDISADKVNDESNTLNNAQSIVILCYKPAPDITIPDMSANPASPINISTSTTVTMTVANIGDLAAGAFQVNLSATDGAIDGSMIFPVTKPVIGLLANSSMPVPFTYTCPAGAGTYKITAIADPPANERNTGNNNNSIDITCIPLYTPDINMLPADIKTPLMLSTTTTLTGSIRNAGTAATGPFSVALSATGGTLNPSTWDFVDMSAGSPTYFGYFDYTCPASAGTYNITLNATPVAGETHIDDNLVVAQISCVSAPDIQVSNLTATNYSIYINQSTLINIPVRNIGSGPSNAFTLASETNGGTLSGKTLSISALSGNSGTVYGHETFNCPATPGNYTINATAPPVSGETNTANNFNLTIIECKPAAPFFTIGTGNFPVYWDRCIGQSGCNYIPLGQEFRFAYTVDNIGQLPVTVPTVAKRVVLQTQPASPDYTISSFITHANSPIDWWAPSYAGGHDLDIPPLGVGEHSGVINERAACPDENTTFSMKVWPDFYNAVPEAGGHGGWAIGDGSVYCKSAPDIEIGAISGANLIPVGTSTTIYIPYQNVGTYFSTFDQFSITVSATAGTITGSPVTIGVTPIGIPYETTVTYTCPDNAQTFTITATASDVTYETNFANNVNTYAIICY